MTSKIVRSLVVTLILAFLTTGLALAKETIFKAVITGPGLVEDIEIMAPARLSPLASLFFKRGLDYQRVEQPRNPGEGYVVTRYVRSLDSSGRFFTEAKPWDRVIYYPRPNGEPGLVYYEGYVLGWSGPLGPNQIQLWYEAPPEGDAAMWKILAEHKATLAQETSGATLFIPMAAVVLSALALLAAVGLAVRVRRAMKHSG